MNASKAKAPQGNKVFFVQHFQMHQHSPYASSYVSSGSIFGTSLTFRTCKKLGDTDFASHPAFTDLLNPSLPMYQHHPPTAHSAPAWHRRCLQNASGQKLLGAMTCPLAVLSAFGADLTQARLTKPALFACKASPRHAPCLLLPQRSPLPRHPPPGQQCCTIACFPHCSQPSAVHCLALAFGCNLARAKSPWKDFHIRDMIEISSISYKRDYRGGKKKSTVSDVDLFSIFLCFGYKILLPPM